MAEQNFTIEELESEEWRPVIGHEGRYAVSSLGRVRSESHGKHIHRASLVLRPHTARGYYIITLSKGRRGLRVSPTVHKLVATAFLGTRPSENQINHIDGNRLNNRASNLEYVTPSENMLHAFRLGLVHRVPQGGAHPKVSTVQAKKIREMAATGLSYATISRLYPICDDRTVSRVVLKKGPYLHI
jgi:hypothetical protein